MTPVILDGKRAAQLWSVRLQEAAHKVQQIVGRPPSLTIVNVGSYAPSQTYITHKVRVAATLGITTHVHSFLEGSCPSQVMELIEQLNHDPCVDGIILQLPLPSGFDSQFFCSAVAPSKDVDGLHPTSQGLLDWRDMKAFIPCTPLGVMKLLDTYSIPVAGQHVVIVGRSVLVGRPLSQLFLSRDATVTVTHSRTKDLAYWTRQASILVVAVGKGRFIGAQHVCAGCHIVDVGLTSYEGKLIGDVDALSVMPYAQSLTPVPGGVGPMTVMSLMHNVVKASCNHHGINIEQII